ncbi:hypothetical protein N9112_00390 [bacterium]|nr:hypothetical protein [bacterium]
MIHNPYSSEMEYLASGPDNRYHIHKWETKYWLFFPGLSFEKISVTDFGVWLEQQPEYREYGSMSRKGGHIYDIRTHEPYLNMGFHSRKCVGIMADKIYNVFYGELDGKS